MPENTSKLLPLQARLTRYLSRFSRGRRCGCRFGLRMVATCLVLLWLICLVLYFQVLQFDREPEDRSMTAPLHFGSLGREELISEAQKQADRPNYENTTEDESIPENVTRREFPGISGFGEMGKAILMKPEKLSKGLKQLYDEGFNKTGFNQLASDIIGVRRNLPDFRHGLCKSSSRYQMLPISKLPKTSIIIIFHNEAWSALLRSVHSVLERSPMELVQEIILVDDFSDPVKMKHLKEPLDQYMAAYPQVKILRSHQRVGLTQARLIGTKVAKGPVLTFLDSHIEATTGWLEPLLDRISRKRETVVCPVIDIISDETLKYAAVDYNQVGGFDWTLTFRWKPMPERERLRRQSPIDPIRSPAMAGGLFAIDKAYFEKLGYYDDGFDIWGSENLELSLKTWMCGGMVEFIPCSRVGHIFRDKSPYTWNTTRTKEGADVLKWNSLRLALVWLDEYADIYINRTGGRKKMGEYGNITGRIELRKSLKCKRFQWYLVNVYPERDLPENDKADGEVRNEAWDKKYCLDAMTKDNSNVTLYPCHGQGGNQYWSISKNDELRRDDYCVDWDGKNLKLLFCHGKKGHQLWAYNHKKGYLKHALSDKCLTLPTLKGLTLEPCRIEDKPYLFQKWRFERILRGGERERST